MNIEHPILELIEAYVETRHTLGAPEYNPKTAFAKKLVHDELEIQLQLVPSEQIIFQLAGLTPEFFDTDTGPGYWMCPTCGATKRGEWNAGYLSKLEDPNEIVHAPACAAQWARKISSEMTAKESHEQPT